MTFITRSSHVRVFERCNRRWFFETVLGHKSEDTPALRFGTAMHLELERWLRDGTPPDDKLRLGDLYPGLAARKSFHWLPVPGKDLMVEHKFIDTKLVSGVEYHGTVDLADPRELVPIHLYDHKSTAGLAFAKTVTELQQDVSATFYAHQLRWLWGEPTIKSRWIYTERARSGRVKAVDFDLTSAMIDDRLAVTVKSVEAMKTLSGAASYIDATPNYEACNDYNRKCPHWGKCELTKSIISTESENKMNLLAKVANGVHPKTEETELVEAIKTEVTKTLSLREKMAAAKALVQPSTEKLLETSIALNEASAAVVEEALAVGVNPPDAAAPTFEASTVEEPKAAKKLKTKRGKQLDLEEIIEQKATPLEPEIVAAAAEYSQETLAAEVAEDEAGPLDEIRSLIESAHKMLSVNVKTRAHEQALVRLSEAAFWLGKTA